ncbi:MAG: anaerobic C4-dicarboxylate transporter family protein, partial [Candidatus Korobacteraceae bacterium]
GIGIGLAGGLGLVILVFGFRLQPSSPPIDVMLIIMAVITMVSTMQAAGGLDYLVTLAERILRKNPNRITLVAPLVTYCFSVFCGTAYVAFSLYPVIVEVAYDAKVRPERPLSVATIAATQAVTASPMSAATAVLITMVSPRITLGQILMICIPAGLCGILLAALSVYRRGIDLEKDPEFQRRVAAGEIAPPKKREERITTRDAKLSVALFALAVISIVALGSFPNLLPSWTVAGKVTKLSIPNALEMVMLSFGLATALLFKIKPAKIINNSIFTTGMMAVVAIFGIAWMVDTFFNTHSALLIATVGGFVKQYPYLFALALVIMAALLMSQGAAIRAIGPLALSLGVSPAHMVGMFHAASAINIIPGTGAVIGVVSFDRTGTTTIGKFVFNHSFLRPGLISITTSVIVGYLLASILL